MPLSQSWTIAVFIIYCASMDALRAAMDSSPTGLDGAGLRGVKSHMLGRGSTQYSTKVSVGLVLAGIALFAVSLNDPFHFDDVLILKDSNVTNAARWFHFFNPLYLRQLTFFTFYLNYLVGGAGSFGFHLVNVALHIANAILFWRLLRSYVDPWMSSVAAFVFLAHPVQTEPVLYV